MGMHAMSLSMARLSVVCRTGFGQVAGYSSRNSWSTVNTVAVAGVDQRLFSTSTVSCLRSRPTLTKDPRARALAQKPPRQHVFATSQGAVARPPHPNTPIGYGQSQTAPLPPQPQAPSQQVVINQALYTQQPAQPTFQLHHHHHSTSSGSHHHHHHPTSSTSNSSRHTQHPISAPLYSEPYLRLPRRRSTFFSSRAHKEFTRYVALLKSQAKHRGQHHRYKDHHHSRHHRSRPRDSYNDPYYNLGQYWYAAHRYRKRPFKTLAIGTALGISGYTLYNDSVAEKLTQLQTLAHQGYQASLHWKANNASGFSTSSLNASPSSSSSTSDKSWSSSQSSPPPPSSPFQKHQIKMLTPEQVSQHLARNQKSYKTGDKDQGGKKGPVAGYCINQVASNNPIEDDLSKHVVRGKDPSEDQYFFGVFDGHGGWCCSHKVAQELAPYVAAELSLVGERDRREKSEAVVEAIQRAFVNLDDKIVHDAVERVLESSSSSSGQHVPTRAMATSLLLPAVSGSCALLAYVDARTNDLYVACTGDSRAVLGVKEKQADGSHLWKAVPLSYDQTGRTKSEVLRMREEHPGEEDTVIMRGRVLGGLEPTRAFGDARYKWSRDIQDKVFQLFPAYRQPNAYLKTPPYVTAKPVVRHHKLRPEDSFLVLATDGLWDKLTTEEVVQLVGDLLDGKKGVEETFLDRAKVSVQQIEQELTPAKLKPKGPESQLRQFTFRDRTNASTHLVRNALGGADDDKVAATLAIPAPMSRVYRDDITVTVVFFSEQDTKETLMEALEIDGLVEI